MDQIAGNQHVPGFEPTDDARNIFIAFKGHVHAVDEHIGNAVQGRYDDDIALCSLFHQVKNPGNGFFAVKASPTDFNDFQFLCSFSTQALQNQIVWFYRNQGCLSYKAGRILRTVPAIFFIAW